MFCAENIPLLTELVRLAALETINIVLLTEHTLGTTLSRLRLIVGAEQHVRIKSQSEAFRNRSA